jgi:drug/metabolite transporter (DMT)-like permease
VDKDVKLKAYAAGVIFAILVGFSFLSVKVSVQIASPIEILTFRYNFAFLMVCAVAAVFKFARPNLKGKKKALICSAAFYISFMILQTTGLIFSTSIESAIIFAIIPIIAKIIAKVLLNETSTWKQNVFVGMSVSAVILMIVMSAGDVTVNLSGVIILIISSVCLAASNVLLRYVRKEHGPFSVTFATAMFGFFVFNAGYIAYLLKTQGSVFTYFSPCVNMQFILATAYLGIPCIVFSMWLMSYMLKHMEAIRGIIFGNLSTAISIMAGIIILGEPMAFYNIICTVVIIIGVIGVSAAANKEIDSGSG